MTIVKGTVQVWKLDNFIACEIIIIIVTGFAKRGLPHTSDFQTSTIHNFTCVRAMDLQIVQFRVPT